MSNEFRELEQMVLAWAQSKGIMDKATPWDQAQKMREEALELADACLVERESVNCLPELMFQDAYHSANLETGDVFVTLIILSALRGVDPMDCLEQAYQKIAKRTGKMVGGFFVKDE